MGWRTIGMGKIGSRALVAASLGVALVAMAHVAAADGDAVAAADKLFRDAKSLATQGRYAEACPKLEESQRLDPALGTEFNLADCYEHTARPASAWRLFNDVAEQAHVAGKAEREKAARDRASAVDPKVARLTLVVSTPDVAGLELSCDGNTIQPENWNKPLALDPGVHTFAATAPDHERWSSNVTIAVEGGRPELVVPALVAHRASPPPPAAPVASPALAPTHQARPAGLGAQRVGGLALVGLGVVGVGVGTAFGLLSMAKHADANSSPCPGGGACADQGAVDDWHAANSDGNVSTVAFIVGGAALAAGAILWFTAPKSQASPEVGLVVTGSSVGVRGSW